MMVDVFLNCIFRENDFWKSCKYDRVFIDVPRSTFFNVMDYSINNLIKDIIDSGADYT
jgi:hypothetical protein